MRWPARSGVVGVLLAAASGVAAAHEVGGTRFDAPLPLSLLYLGAGATVVATAWWLAGGSAPAWGERRRLAELRRPNGDALARAVRVGFFLLFLLALGAGLLGPQVPAENVATVFVWPVWLKGVALVSATVGSPWRVISPWRALYDGLARLEGEDVALLGRYPEWLGEWPALAGFVVVFGVVENLTAVPRSPRATTLLVAGYALVMVVGALAYGEEWLDRADALAVLYRLFGRVAPLRVERTRRGGVTVAVRAPWRGCATAVGTLAAVGFVVAALFTVSFDGFTSTPEYQAVLFAARDTVGPGAGVLLYGVGLVAFLAAFAVVVARADAAAGGRDLRGALLAFGPTLLPIAVAYEVAHNYPFVVSNLGRLVALLGTTVGADLGPSEPLAWLPLAGYWASQVVLVVGGHVVAVVAAHAVTVERYPARLATRAHAPLTALMVGYTVLSLWIISRPVAA